MLRLRSFQSVALAMRSVRQDSAAAALPGSQALRLLLEGQLSHEREPSIWKSFARQHRYVHSGPPPQASLLQKIAEFGSSAPDPFSLVKDELETVSERLRRTILTDVPLLSKAASYFFQIGSEGKRLRPTMLLLMASSLSTVVPSTSFLAVDERPPAQHPVEQRRRQQRIAEITELIHVASLLHDDVIDSSDSRRGLQALNSVLGNKVAILAGDFLLARASITLASLRDVEVIQLLSQVIEDLVSGEILQMSSTPDHLVSLDHYVRKTFFKTASLMANSCKAIAILGGQPREVSTLAWDYGRHLGLAFQLVDDMLDFTGNLRSLGKPALNDLNSGLATAPVLYAAQEHPQLRPMILRKFAEPGDVQLAQKLVADSSGIEKTRQFAAEQAQQAADVVAALPPAQTEHAQQCRQGLLAIVDRVLTRTK